MSDSPSPDKPAELAPPGPAAPTRGSIFGSVARHLANVGQGMWSVISGERGEPPPAAPTAPESSQTPATGNHEHRIGLMHTVAEKLRGAADGYIAAKLDEIEARVDAKLDDIEHRIDHKIVELHQQIAEMRDRELRHRLRLLKITLIFTVLVALLSLGYKLASKHWT